MWSRLTQAAEALMVIPAIATYYFLDSKLVSVRSTTGSSMHPTIDENSIIVVDKFFYRLRTPELQVGDIVLATQPTNPQTHICKRVIQTGNNSLPGNEHLIIPEGNLWLEGDNKKASYDSRHHGCVPEHLIEGKVIFVLSI